MQRYKSKISARRFRGLDSLNKLHVFLMVLINTSFIVSIIGLGKNKWTYLHGLTFLLAFTVFAFLHLYYANVVKKRLEGYPHIKCKIPFILRIVVSLVSYILLLGNLYILFYLRMGMNILKIYIFINPFYYYVFLFYGIHFDYGTDYFLIDKELISVDYKVKRIKLDEVNSCVYKQETPELAWIRLDDETSLSFCVDSTNKEHVIFLNEIKKQLDESVCDLFDEGGTVSGTCEDD